ncbi:hypothetical protein FJR48_11020 [Sulfurimonas lithotrophica]|uniref:Uncharacterized protein n=1 Tax=Sulfurimonas lithotrophica TaxID=2590022 RepID=A0A5P8P3P3_9BACT|nr:hypothetical protein [Sulfurimonas lithotrophica]QFR50231.1 hypothetical protein FJR48_11020 [Sulfurimonas lithotrophica]
MNTTRYLFQSPYHSQVQFGRPDPSSEQNQKTDNNLTNLNDVNNSVQKEAQSFQATQTTEVKPKVSSANKLDVYA